jgi:uncharacterized membrane protein
VLQGAGRAGRGLAQQVRGLSGRVRELFGSGNVEANVLIARVRACLGRMVSHPAAIHVSVPSPDRVLLRGAVLAWERGPLMRAVAAVPGVRGVQEQLAVHESGEQLSALPAARSRPSARVSTLRPRWSRSTRLAAAAAGGGLLWNGLSRRGIWGALSATAGSVLLLRSLLRPTRAAGGRGRRQRDRTVAVSKSLQIQLPVPQVFGALRDCESFSGLLRNIQTIERRSDGSTYWRLAGVPGTPIEWRAVTTQLDQDRLLAWRTVEESPLQHSGFARFEPHDGGTRLQVYLWYRPPAGRLGDALAQLVGAGHRCVLDADLLRLKRYLETGRSGRDAPVVRTH